MFWTPECAPAIVTVLTPATECHSSVIALPQPDNIAIIAEDGIHLRIAGHQVLLAGGATPSDPVAASIPLTSDFLTRAETAVRLWHTLRGEPSQEQLTQQRRWRIGRSLRALDGATAGASYKAIAMVLFGTKRVAAEHWKTSSLKTATARLVTTGKALSRGGYRNLIK